MPDWSYQTLFRPLLFRMPASKAREVTLKAFGTLGRLPFGSFVIRTMGHMELSPLLHSRIGPIDVRFPVGIGGEVDPSGAAEEGLGQIGSGFIEVGPVTPQPIRAQGEVSLLPEEQAVVFPSLVTNEGLEATVRRLSSRKAAVPRFLWIRAMPGSGEEETAGQLLEAAGKLAGLASGFVLDWYRLGIHNESIPFEGLYSVASTLKKRFPECALLIKIPLEAAGEDVIRLLQGGGTAVGRSEPPARSLLERFDGIVVGSSVRTAEGDVTGRGNLVRSKQMLQRLEGLVPGGKALIVSGGVHEPADALELAACGATHFMLNSGMVYSGPGLPKRINEAILYEKLPEDERRVSAPFWRYWGWMCLLGAGMVIGGVLAWLVAATSVLLPYDEAFLGMSVDQIRAVYPRLAAFISHDRITLAGTMISIGILYYHLGKYGMKHELHWAKTAVTVSAIAGFGSFFLYIGYGYFDQMHAVLSGGLLPFFLISLFGKGDRALDGRPNLRNTSAWKCAQWGQLCFVIIGFGFCIGGLVISTVGITGVFVPEDLAFLGLSPQEINQINERLIPVIAHDRAGFGGALFSDALAILAAALWGIQEGRAWLWRMYLWGGIPGFAAGFSVHMHIGYTDFIHLLPLYAMLVLYMAGLILLYPYLCISRASA
ncbi:hypothetical protein [Paenibacillus turpanensis]|uniref:hypothetical protein n=1 Tax=Paenibacillus turpanensis TaxID=2689078 RepID=UPI0014079BCD|nr:hypothetical protein [Paenibacillus turpanensis]